MARLKLCSHRGCTRVLDMDSKFCEYHQEKYMKLQKERYKDYQRRRLEDYNEVRSQAFYQSLDWDRLKEAVKASFFHIDIFELYLTGRIVEGETVHHIIEVKEEWNSRFDINNLIYLTQKNHLMIHSKYRKSINEKRKVQKILFGLIEAFQKEYKN